MSVKWMAFVCLSACAFSVMAQFSSRDKKLLFNGRDLTGWTALLDYNVTGGYSASEPTWFVTNGCIRTTGTPFGYLRTKETNFANFHLTVRYRYWRKTEKPNSGVFVCLTKESGSFLPTCIENQLCVGKGGDLLGLGHATLKGLANPKGVIVVPKKEASSERPFGEWNTLCVDLSGTSIRTTLNGVVQNEANQLYSSCGAIALQSEGGALEFKDIEIQQE